MNFDEYLLPWKAAKHGDWWYVQDAACFSIAEGLPRDLAHLIAACPELYMAATAMNDSALCDDDGGDFSIIIQEEDWNSLRMALAKACGESA